MQLYRVESAATGSVAQFIGSTSMAIQLFPGADPPALDDGYIWYNATDDKLYARINGATVELGGGGSVIGSEVFRTTLDPTTWTVSTQNIATISGGAVRIETMALWITTTLTSGGSATLAIGETGNTQRFMATTAVAQLTAGKFLNIAGGSNGEILQTRPTAFPRHMNSVGSPNITATVGTAVFNAGVIELVIIYTPLTSGATIA